MTIRSTRRRRFLPAALGLALLAAPAAGAERDRAVESTYREALSQLAAGDEAAALAELIRLELDAVGDAGREDLARLRASELEVARRLEARDSESLVPIVRLHERAYVELLAERRLQLAVHSRELTAELVEMYAGDSQRAGTRQLASELLTSLGGHLQEASMASVAIALYERAVALDRTNVTALLGLANVFERQGSYQRALPYLERALDAEPDHREARLRRAILLLRLGRKDEGETILLGLIGQRQEDWILSLAYQELARERSRAGDYGRARDLLLEASRRLPRDPSLPVQLAYLEDRTRTVGSPAALAEALRQAAASSEPSPRSLYGQTSGESLAELRRTLDGHSRDRLPELRKVLRETEIGRRGG